MSKKIIYALGLGGALGASLIVGGVATSDMFNGEKIPMTGEETIVEEQVAEVEYVPTPEQADIVVEEVIDEVVEPKAEIVEEQAEEHKQTPEEACEVAKKVMLEKFGTLDFFEAVSSLPNAKGNLERLGITDWETIRAEYYYGDVMLFVPRNPRSFVHQIASQQNLRMLVSLDRDINNNCK